MIQGFKGEHRFLSNFWPALIVYQGIIYPTSEHAYQASKTDTHEIKLEIATLPTPGKAKKYGKNICATKQFNENKATIMLEILRLKFLIPELREKLLATGDKLLEETNTWGDTFWGVCNGKGDNMLGKILMRVRKEIRDAENNQGG